MPASTIRSVERTGPAGPRQEDQTVTYRPTRMLAVTLVSAGLLVGAACSDDPNASTTTEAPATTEADGGATGGEAGSPETTLNTEPYVGPVGDLVGEALTHYLFTTLAGYAVETNLVDALKAEGPYTVFAPPDPAFDAIPLETLRAVRDDKELLTTVLLYHVLPGKYLAEDLVPGEYETAAGIPLTITRAGGSVFVNGVALVESVNVHDMDILGTDIEASNGVIHVVSEVLLPPES